MATKFASTARLAILASQMSHQDAIPVFALFLLSLLLLPFYHETTLRPSFPHPNTFLNVALARSVKLSLHRTTVVSMPRSKISLLVSHLDEIAVLSVQTGILLSVGDSRCACVVVARM